REQGNLPGVRADSPMRPASSSSRELNGCCTPLRTATVSPPRSVHSRGRSSSVSEQMRAYVAHLGIVALLVGLMIGSAAHAATGAQRCAAAKMRAGGKMTRCLLVIDAKAATGATIDPARVQRCGDQLGDPARGAFARAEAVGDCVVTGDAPVVQGHVDA